LAVTGVATRLDGAHTLVELARSNQPVPTHPYLVMAPAKLIFALVIAAILVLKAEPSSRQTGSLFFLVAGCLAVGIAAFVVGGLLWLALTWGRMPEVMTPVTWIFCLVVAPGMLLILAGIVGIVKIALFRGDVGASTIAVNIDARP